MEYEFSETENRIIGATGGRATIYGYISIVVGLLGMVAGVGVGAVLGGAALLIGVSIALACLPTLIAGSWYVQAGKALKGVVVTEGDDVSHMMVALNRVAAAFKLEGIVTVVAFLLSFVVAFVLVANR